ncbi:MAG: hypothetical protein R3C26_08095 [Calditrichia bacterium]
MKMEMRIIAGRNNKFRFRRLSEAGMVTVANPLWTFKMLDSGEVTPAATLITLPSASTVTSPFPTSGVRLRQQLRVTV